jgi:hypothetical protein
MIVKPKKRGWHLWQLVAVVNHLRITGAEPQWRDCRIAVAVGINKAAVQMRHHAHVIPKRS